jgi:adenylosuccinate lyase
VILPEAFLAVDEMLRKAISLVWTLEWDEGQIAQNVARWGAYSATECVLMAAVKAGADRGVVHVKIAQVANEAHANGNPAHLFSLSHDEYIGRYLDPEAILLMLIDVNDHIGQANERTQTMMSKMATVAENLDALIEIEETLLMTMAERREEELHGRIAEEHNDAER